MDKFGLDNIPDGTPLATLENVFVPLYLGHRYQVEAVAKMIGGVNYSYSVKGDQQPSITPVSPHDQQQARQALLKTISPEVLLIPEHILKLIPPHPMGYSRDRELFKLYTGLTFDPFAAAESASHHSLHLMMNPQRLARILEQGVLSSDQMELKSYLNFLAQGVKSNGQTGYKGEIMRMNEKLFMVELFKVLNDADSHLQVKAHALEALMNLKDSVSMTQAHGLYIQTEIDRFLKSPDQYPIPAPKSLPDGSPIGCGQ